MAIPLLYLAGAAVAALALRKGKQGPDPAAAEPSFEPATSNPLVLSGTGMTRGGLKIASQLQRDRFVTGGQGGVAVTPPTNFYTQQSKGKPIGFR